MCIRDSLEGEERKDAMRQLRSDAFRATTERIARERDEQRGARGVAPGASSQASGAVSYTHLDVYKRQLPTRKNITHTPGSGQIAVAGRGPRGGGKWICRSRIMCSRVFNLSLIHI